LPKSCGAPLLQLRELPQLEEDPVSLVPGLPGRNAPQAGQDQRDDPAHHRLGIVQVDAAVGMVMIRRHRKPSALVVPLSIDQAAATPPVILAVHAGSLMFRHVACATSRSWMNPVIRPSAPLATRWAWGGGRPRFPPRIAGRWPGGCRVAAERPRQPRPPSGMPGI